MESRRLPDNSHWYHETLATVRTDSASFHSEAACPSDPFLLAADKDISPSLRQVLYQDQAALLAARDLCYLLFPQTVVTDCLHTLTLYDRLSTALTVAQVTGIQRLCDHYAARLNPLPGPDSSRKSNQRLTQITEYARLMSSQPSSLATTALQRLKEVGLTLPDIVSFHQLIGFVNYQARVVAGLHALRGLPVRCLPGQTSGPEAPLLNCQPSLKWHLRLTLPEESCLSAAQRHAVDAWSDLAAPPGIIPLLAQDEAVLYALTQLRRAVVIDNNLAQAVCARINGSGWCLLQSASASQREMLMAGVQQAVHHTGFREEVRQQMQAAAWLTRSPDQFNATHLPPSDDQPDKSAHWRLIQQIALANWQNRLVQTLGYLTSD